MAAGRLTQLTKQAGEYLVAAQLAQRGLFAATFSGSVPYFDIVAVDDSGRSQVIQVKTIAGPSWQLDARDFLDIVWDGPIQSATRRRIPYPNMPWVMVRLAAAGEPEFFVLKRSDVQRLVYKHYTAMLAKQGGIRPRNSSSTHTALWPKHLERFRSQWDLIVPEKAAPLAGAPA